MPRNIQVNEELLDLLPKPKRNRAIKALEELELARKQNPLLFYQPNPKQHTFHSFEPVPLKRFLFLGGNQSGKTTAGAVDCLIQTVDKRMLPEHLKPYRRYQGSRFKCWVGAPGREEIEDYIFDKIREWVPPSELAGGSWKAAYDSMHHTLSFKHGEWAFKTYEQETNKWGGATLDCVWFDEEPPADKYGEGRIRVMRKEGYLLFTMTPVEGLTHMFEEFQTYVEKAEARSNDATQDANAGVVLVDMDDNPVLTEEAKRQALIGFSREEIAARKSGKFVALHGLIYGDYDRDVHELPAFEMDREDQFPQFENTNVIVGIDPGLRHACGVVWTLLTPDDQMIVFEEGYYQNMTIARVCGEIHRVNSHYGVTPLYYVIDPAARNRQSQTGRSDQMEFADHGVITLPGQHEVRPGINRVKERFQRQALYLTDNCEQLRKELRMYRWRKPPRTEDGAKEIPVKKDDHLLDALRYVVMSRPWLPEEERPDTETKMQKKIRKDIERYEMESEIPVA